MTSDHIVDEIRDCIETKYIERRDNERILAVGEEMLGVVVEKTLEMDEHPTIYEAKWDEDQYQKVVFSV